MEGWPAGGGEGEGEDGKREEEGCVGGDEDTEERCEKEGAEGDLRDEEAAGGGLCGVAEEVVGEEGEREEQEGEVVEEEVVADEHGGEECEGKRGALEGSEDEERKREDEGEDAAPGGSVAEEEERAEEVGHQRGHDAEVDLGGAVGGEVVGHGKE